LRQITLRKDSKPGTFDVDMNPINVSLEAKYGEATFNDIATLLNGTDRRVWHSENIKRLAQEVK
jgi:hypothetical protein